jgi:ubiquitin-protein ligase
MDIINDKISKPLSRRLIAEYKQLVKRYKIDINVNIDDKEVIHLTFCKKSTNPRNNDDQYHLIIPKYYPFAVPSMIINNVPYLHHNVMPSKRFSIILKKIMGTDCLCCSSLSCNSNWKATKNIINLLTEAERNENIKYKIGINILIDQIKDKYNLTYLDIYEWIF